MYPFAGAMDVFLQIIEKIEICNKYYRVMRTISACFEGGDPVSFLKVTTDHLAARCLALRLDTGLQLTATFQEGN